MANTLYKICIRCDVRKKIRRFSKNERMPGGHINVCKNCVKKGVAANAAKKADNRKLLMGWGKV